MIAIELMILEILSNILVHQKCPYLFTLLVYLCISCLTQEPVLFLQDQHRKNKVILFLFSFHILKRKTRSNPMA